MFQFCYKNKSDLFKKIFFTLFVVSVFGFGVLRVADAATLYFNPASGNYALNDIFTVNVLVNTENVSINNAEGVINFPSDILEVVSVSKSNSIFSLWVEEPSFSNSTGVVSFNGGLPTPGFSGASGKILSIVFRSKKTGSISTIISSASVRANDGLGTNVLKSSSDAIFSIGGESQKPVIPTLTTPTINKTSIVINSDTHPDQTKWYTISDAVFSWELPPGIKTVRMQLDEEPFSIPTFSYGPVNSKEISDINQGISYFHLRAQDSEGWVNTSHYKIQIDNTKPEKFEVVEVPRNDPTERKISFTFEAEDNISGIDYYEVTIDGDDTETIPVSKGNVYNTDDVSVGRHIIYFRAVDRAGNYTERILEFVVEEQVLFTIGKWAFNILSILIPLIIIIFLLSIMIVYLYIRFVAFRRRAYREVREAEDVLDERIALIKNEINRGLDIKKINADLNDSKKMIKKEIKDIIKK